MTSPILPPIHNLFNPTPAINSPHHNTLILEIISIYTTLHLPQNIKTIHNTSQIN